VMSFLYIRQFTSCRSDNRRWMQM